SDIDYPWRQICAAEDRRLGEISERDWSDHDAVARPEGFGRNAAVPRVLPQPARAAAHGSDSLSSQNELVAFADDVIELITFHCAPVAAHALVWNWHTFSVRGAAAIRSAF